MTSALAKAVRSSRRFGLKLKRNQDGTTAVEFALIALPFFALLFGILSVCQLFFWQFTSENAVWTASRDMRTGAFQTGASGSPYAAYYSGGVVADPNGLKTEFRKQICKFTPNYTDCFNNSVVLVQSTSTFASITQPNCKNNSNGLVTDADAMTAFNAGSSSSIVIVTLCWAWGFGGKLPFFQMPGLLANGALLIQSSAVFETEPY